MMDCAKQLYREGGIRSVFRGTALTLMRGNEIIFHEFHYVIDRCRCSGIWCLFCFLRMAEENIDT